MRNPYTDAWRGFTKQTEKHKLTVLHDEGLYRHLRMAKPGTQMYSWDIVTWPGHLSITGDVADGFTFARTEDMFDFFTPSVGETGPGDGSPFINPDYWAEKLSLEQRDSWEKFSEQEFLARVREAAIDVEVGPDVVDEAVEDARWHANHEFEAYTWASDHPEWVGQDFNEVSLRRADIQFLIACYAIVTTISTYQKYLSLYSAS